MLLKQEAWKALELEFFTVKTSPVSLVSSFLLLM